MIIWKQNMNIIIIVLAIPWPSTVFMGGILLQQYPWILILVHVGHTSPFFTSKAGSTFIFLPPSPKTRLEQNGLFHRQFHCPHILSHPFLKKKCVFLKCVILLKSILKHSVCI